MINYILGYCIAMIIFDFLQIVRKFQSKEFLDGLKLIIESVPIPVEITCLILAIATIVHILLAPIIMPIYCINIIVKWRQA